MVMIVNLGRFNDDGYDSKSSPH